LKRNRGLLGKTKTPSAVDEEKLRLGPPEQLGKKKGGEGSQTIGNGPLRSGRASSSIGGEGSRDGGRRFERLA